jgi:hypothetical protein
VLAGRSFGRERRRAAYSELLRVRLRTDTALRVSSLASQPLNGVSATAGFGLAVRTVNLLTDDVAEVVAAWRAVRAVGTSDCCAAADELVLALAASMADVVEPSWFKPRQRSRAKWLYLEQNTSRLCQYS